MNRQWLILISMVLLAGCSKGFRSATSGIDEFASSSRSNAGLSSLRITTPAQDGYFFRDSAQFAGDCEPNQNVEVRVSGSLVDEFNCVDGSFNTNVSLPGNDGTHTVQVSQMINGFRILDFKEVIKDTVPPSISILSPGPGSATNTGLSVSGTCDEGFDVVIQGDVRSSVDASCIAGSFSASVEFSNGDGNKILNFAQTDFAGNSASENLTIIYDTTPPALTITTPANSEGTTGITLTGACESGTSVNISGSGVLSPLTVDCNSSAYTSDILFSSGEGGKLVNVEQSDVVGNSSTVSSTFVRVPSGAPVPPPVVAFTSPDSGTATNRDLSVSGTCTVGLDVLLTGDISSQVTSPCPSGTFSANIQLAGADGNKTVTATQTDQYMQQGADARSFVKDNLAPVVTIASPSSGTISNGTVSVSGSCESGLNVVLYGDVNSPQNVSCSMSAYSASITLNAGDGAKNIYVAQTDAATNQTITQVSVTRDTTAPVVAITAPAQGSQSQGNISLSGSCENGSPVIISGPGVASQMNASCSSGAFSVSIMLSDGTGTKMVNVSQTDAAGNTGSDSRSFERIAPPVDGVLLYAQHCASCHGELSVSSRKNRTAQEISNAISSVNSMNRLSFLSNEEVQAIADALVDDGSGGNSGTLVGLTYRPTVGHRRYVASHMESIFYDYSSPGSADDDILNEIQRNILANPGNMGGPCTMHDPVHTSDGASTPRIFFDNDTCDPGFGDLKATAKALPLPVVNALRKGHTTNVCEAILENNKAVSTALSRVNLSTSSPASSTNLGRVFGLFYPGQSPDTNIINAMANVHAAGGSVSNIERWRFTLLAHCMSSVGDLL